MLSALLLFTAALLPNLYATGVNPVRVALVDYGDVSWTLVPVAQMQPQATGEMGYLGVSLADLDRDRARTLKLPDERGAFVRAVMEGSPADKAGIQPDDFIVNYDGQTVFNSQQISQLVQETQPGKRVKVKFWREGKIQLTWVVIGSSSSNPTARVQELPMPGWTAPSMDYPTPMLVWHNPLAGFDYEPVDAQLGEYFGVKSGVLVRAVQPGSPAEHAGLRAGDVIFSVGQQSIMNEHEVSSTLRRHSNISISVMRDHKRKDVVLTLP